MSVRGNYAKRRSRLPNNQYREVCQAEIVHTRLRCDYAIICQMPEKSFGHEWRRAERICLVCLVSSWHTVVSLAWPGGCSMFMRCCHSRSVYTALLVGRSAQADLPTYYCFRRGDDVDPGFFRCFSTPCGLDSTADLALAHLAEVRAGQNLRGVYTGVMTDALFSRSRVLSCCFRVA